MIKISQLPAIKLYQGTEFTPIVQEGETRKALPIFADSSLKVNIPENASIVTKVNGEVINLISAVVVDGVTTVMIGDKEVSLYKDNSIIVTESETKDGNFYGRTNNGWVIKNPITQINHVQAPTGGGSISLSYSDVDAHKNNTNLDGIAYVSQDGEWVDAKSIFVPLITAITDQKADKEHTHEIDDINLLRDALGTIEHKAEKEHKHEISDVNMLQKELNDIKNSIPVIEVPTIETVTGLSDALSDINTEIATKANKEHTHEISDIQNLQPKLDQIDTEISTTKSNITKIRDEINKPFINAKHQLVTTSDASGTLPLEEVIGNKMSIVDNVLVPSESGIYFVQFITDIDSDNTIVQLDGVQGLVTDTKGNSVRAGIFQLEKDGKYSLKYTGQDSIITSSIIAYKL